MRSVNNSWNSICFPAVLRASKTLASNSSRELGHVRHPLHAQHLRHLSHAFLGGLQHADVEGDRDIGLDVVLQTKLSLPLRWISGFLRRCSIS